MVAMNKIATTRDRSIVISSTENKATINKQTKRIAIVDNMMAL